MVTLQDFPWENPWHFRGISHRLKPRFPGRWCGAQSSNTLLTILQSAIAVHKSPARKPGGRPSPRNSAWRLHSVSVFHFIICIYIFMTYMAFMTFMTLKIEIEHPEIDYSSMFIIILLIWPFGSIWGVYLVLR